MSLIVFPFKDETVEVVTANLKTAASHDRVEEVWAVAASENTAMGDVAAMATLVGDETGKPVHVFAQSRMGHFRPGKGDGMNTAIRLSAERGFARTHFYDADITNFDASWIDGAEHAADRGFGVVRHRFPRAATDAMITWMITRPALATLFPGTLLPRLGQPLGGEILLTLPAVEALAADPFVIARSDWGIDTVITHATAAMDLGIYEHNAHDGKRHALYGSLTDIREMLLECLDAVASLAGREEPATDFAADPPAEAPPDLKKTVAYDVESTRRSVARPPDIGEREVLGGLGFDPDGPTPIDASRWLDLLPRLLDGFDLADPSWRSAAFRLWVHRVIDYTTTWVPKGYDDAMTHLEETIRQFEVRAADLIA